MHQEHWNDEQGEDSQNHGEHPDLQLPDDLPPVQPPSARMIVQLFVVPALIVGAIVGVYALFGRMASQEQDWRQLVTDVRSENPLVRWKGALGLAQLLDVPATTSSSRPALTENPEVAAALAELYGELIDVRDPDGEKLKQVEFLSKALGRMRTPDITLPVFQRGIQADRDRAVRKHSMIGLAMAAGGEGAGVEGALEDQVVSQLISISREPDPLLRHQAAFALGLLPTPAAQDRLKGLLDDADQMTRINAAIGFARHGNAQGVPVFHELLDEAGTWKLDPAGVENPEDEARYFENRLMLTNALKAIHQLQPQLQGTERTQFISELQAVSQQNPDAELRSEILQLLNDLQAG